MKNGLIIVSILFCALTACKQREVTQSQTLGSNHDGMKTKEVATCTEVDHKKNTLTIEYAGDARDVAAGYVHWTDDGKTTTFFAVFKGPGFTVEFENQEDKTFYGEAVIMPEGNFESAKDVPGKGKLSIFKHGSLQREAKIDCMLHNV